MKGGEVIGAGGFGCVFNPRINCIDKSITRSDNIVSKMMLKKHATKEFNELIKISKIIKETIPNYDKYFLLNNIDLCNPGTLTQEDLVHFDQKCSALNIENITSKNINNMLDKVSILNMPYGGISLSKYFKNIWSNQHSFNKNFANINNLLIELLIKAIVPLNNAGISHFDLKSGNILYTNNELKIIDWGLSHIHNNVLPDNWSQHPVQHNIPFSAILLKNTSLDYIESFYKQFTQINDINKPYINKILATNLFHISNKQYDVGHGYSISYNIMIKIYKLFIGGDIEYADINYKQAYLGVDEYVPSMFYINIITDYLAASLDKYVKNGKFNRALYFKEVYCKNADIWGFIMVYFKILNLKSVNQDSILHNNLLTGILSIVFKYCYSPTYSNIPIPINKLIKDLQNLNINLGYVDVYSDKKFMSKYKTLSRRNRTKTKPRNRRKTKPRNKTKTKPRLK